MRRRAAVVGFGCVCALLGAGCSGGDSGPDVAAPTTGVVSDDPLAGGTLRLGIARLPSLDPADVSPASPSASIAADLLYDGLTRIVDGVAAPAVASEWSTPDGGSTWRFTLRSDAVFAGGEAVTAADVEQSIERVKARGAASLVGARLDVVADVRPVGASVVEVVLARPMASLPELVAAPALGIVSAGAVSAGDPSTNASGPFRLAERSGDVVRLARVAGGSALLDGVELHQFADLGDAVDAFDDGSLDWTLVPPERAEAVAESTGADGFVPFQAELFFGFNLADPTFADARFRRAIVAAVDREAVVEAVYFGFAAPLDAVVPEGVVGHDPTRCGSGCRSDPAAAESLLAEAFPGGAGVPEVVIDHEDSAEETALAQAVEQQLEAAGIPASLRAHRAAEFGAFAVSGQQKLVRLGWIGAWPAADAYLEPLFRTASPDNVTGFSDPAVDQLLDAAARTADPEEREELLGEAESLVLAAAPIVPIAQFQLLSAASPAVQDLELDVAGTFDAEAVWLAG